MSFPEALRESRIRRNLTQKAIGNIAGVEQSVFSKYENGIRPFPDDVAIKSMRFLKDPRLKIAYEYEKQSNIINMPLLNNVDENAVVVLDVFMEEATEAIESAKKLKKLVRNKKSRNDFSDGEWAQYMDEVEQIADLSPAMKVLFVAMAEQHGLDPDVISLRLKAKCKSKNYLL
jgi:transcriptional regulator with XRE-family HTH domain